MNHQLVLITGSCPGAGKTTLMNELNERMTEREVRHDTLFESDERWQSLTGRLVGDLLSDAPDRVGSLLFAARSVVDSLVRTDSTLVVDSMTLMPAFTYLVGHQSVETIESYVTDLDTILKSASPLLIYLRCDVRIGWERAIKRSGDVWLNNFLTRLHRGRFVMRPSDIGSSVESAIKFYEDVDALGRSVLANRWTGRMVELETTIDQEHARQQILGELGLL